MTVVSATFPELWPLSKKLSNFAVDRLNATPLVAPKKFHTKDDCNQIFMELVLAEVQHLITLKIRAGDDEKSQWNRALISLNDAIVEEFKLKK